MNAVSLKNNNKLYPGVIALMAAIAVLPILFNGIPVGNDLQQHYQFAGSYYEAIYNGDLLPGLAHSSNLGLGDYGIRLYPPLTYYVLSALFGITGSWFYSSVALYFLVFLAGGCGVYLWAREAGFEKQALIAAAIFTFAPYHLNQIYNNFLLAEFAASAVIPYCLLFITRADRDPAAVNIGGLALSYALLILTHLPSLLIGSVIFAVYAAALLLSGTNRLKRIGSLALGVAAAVAASSFYWSKLVTEIGWLKHSYPEYFSNIYDYNRNFLLRPGNFLSMNEDVLAIWLGDVMLIATLIICVPGFYFLFRNRSELKGPLAASLAASLIAVFMSSVLSKPVWDTAGFIQKVQFPWRWLGLLTVTASLVAAYGLGLASERMKDGKRPVLTAAVGFSLLFFVVSSVFIARQAVFIAPDSLVNSKVAHIVSSPSFECWWPVWAKTNFFKTIEQKAETSRAVSVEKWSPYAKHLRFGEGDAETAELAVLYYPHWKATLNGKPVPVSPSGPGLVAVKLPRGEADVVLSFEEPTAVVVGRYVSLLAFAGIAGALATGFRRRRSD